jgi:hypothetical protein
MIVRIPSPDDISHIFTYLIATKQFVDIDDFRPILAPELRRIPDASLV